MILTDSLKEMFFFLFCAIFGLTENILLASDLVNIFAYEQWVLREASAPITHAIYSCDSQSIYVSFEDGGVGVLTASNLRWRCRINPTSYLPANSRY